MPKTIELDTPIDNGHGQKIKSITLRDPKYGDYMELDLPIIWVSVANGGFNQETPSAMRAWIERLADIDPNLLEQVDLRGALALRDAVLVFFQEARQPQTEKSKSTSSPASSSSAEDGTRGPSRI